MGHAVPRRMPLKNASTTATCWREVLFLAFGGLHGYDQQLEQFLDYLERRA